MSNIIQYKGYEPDAGTAFSDVKPGEELLYIWITLTVSALIVKLKILGKRIVDTFT